jgi:hypothetical protein
MPERSFPLATISSARNTIRLRSGVTFQVASITKTTAVLKAQTPVGITIRIASQLFQDDDDSPTILTSEPAGLGLVTSGLLRIGMTAMLIDYQNDLGERVIALRIPLIDTKVPESAIVFENIQDGNITLRQDGRPDKVVGKVQRAILGSGRIDGTEGIGAGNLVVISPETLVISSSPDNAPPASRFAERRGGIAITTKSDPLPYYMQIKPELPVALLSGIGFAGKSHLAEVQRENGDWERFPTVVGHRADTFSRPHPKGPVVALRIRGATHTPTAQSIQAVAMQFEKSSMADAAQRKIPVISGMHTLRITPTDPGRVASIKIRISDLLFVMNVKPFVTTWDTASIPDGRYSVLVESLDETGALITTTRQEVYVRNRNLAVELATCQW